MINSDDELVNFCLDNGFHLTDILKAIKITKNPNRIYDMLSKRKRRQRKKGPVRKQLKPVPEEEDEEDYDSIKEENNIDEDDKMEEEYKREAYGNNKKIEYQVNFVEYDEEDSISDINEEISNRMIVPKNLKCYKKDYFSTETKKYKFSERFPVPRLIEPISKKGGGRLKIFSIEHIIRPSICLQKLPYTPEDKIFSKEDEQVLKTMILTHLISLGYEKNLSIVLDETCPTVIDVFENLNLEYQELLKMTILEAIKAMPECNPKIMKRCHMYFVDEYSELMKKFRIITSRNLNQFEDFTFKYSKILNEESKSFLIQSIHEMQDLKSKENQSVFFYINSENYSQVKVIAIGSPNTPYAYGCYLFDMLIPENFPKYPPKLVLKTGTLRILNGSYNLFKWSPYISDLGVVKLSILNTKSGENKNLESNPRHSIITDIANSIFQDIFRESDSKWGNFELFCANLQFAMIDVVVRMPDRFKSFYMKHFRVVVGNLMEEIKNWENQLSCEEDSFEGYVPMNSEFFGRIKEKGSRVVLNELTAQLLTLLESRGVLKVRVRK